MTDFTRQKTLNQKFIRVRLDESDFTRLARTIHEATREYPGEIEILVNSADGAETFETSDPQFFESTDMPRELKSVSIRYRKYNAPLACHLEAYLGDNSGVTLSVDGQDVHRVSGLFDDIKRQLEARRVFGRRLLKTTNTVWFALLLSLATALGIYSVFDLGLNIAYLSWPQFKVSAVRNVIVFGAWVLVGLGFITGSYPLLRLIHQSFPGVEFAGRLSDGNRRRRSIIYWVFSAILVPILVRVLFGLIADLATRGS